MVAKKVSIEPPFYSPFPGGAISRVWRLKMKKWKVDDLTESGVVKDKKFSGVFAGVCLSLLAIVFLLSIILGG